MGSLHGIGRASIAFMQFFCCQFGVHCYSFRHVSIIHSLNGFDIRCKLLRQGYLFTLFQRSELPVLIDEDNSLILNVHY